jgi:hypothetical protein
VNSRKAQDKLPNLLDNIKKCIISGNYAFTRHALDRVLERNIDIPTVIDVLLNGYEEKRKTKFDEEINT